MPGRLFPTDLPAGEFVEFVAEGLPSSACGGIHRKDFPARKGMPLGGGISPRGPGKVRRKAGRDDPTQGRGRVFWERKTAQ